MALGIGYVVLVAFRARGLGRGTIRVFPATCLAVAAGAVVLLAMVATGELGAAVDRGLGAYRDIGRGGAAPTDVGLAAMFEITALALGVGVIPVIAALAWLPDALRRPPVVVGLVLTGALWATTLWAQGGFLGEASEERYFFYAVPLVWIAALAAAEERVRVRALAVSTAALALMFAAVPLTVGLTHERAFLAPASAAVQRFLFDLLKEARGVGGRDVLVLVSLALGALAIALWRRWALLAVLVVPAVIQLGMTAYSVLLVPSGRIDGVAARTGTDLDANAWIDQAANGREVAYLANAQPPSADGEQRTMAFWNDAIRGGAQVPATGLPPVPYPTIVMGAANLEVAPDGSVTPPLGRLVLQQGDSPFVQLAGEQVGTSSDGRYEVVDQGAPAKARWLAKGLTPTACSVRETARRCSRAATAASR